MSQLTSADIKAWLAKYSLQQPWLTEQLGVSEKTCNLIVNGHTKRKHYDAALRWIFQQYEKSLKQQKSQQVELMRESL